MPRYYFHLEDGRHLLNDGRCDLLKQCVLPRMKLCERVAGSQRNASLWNGKLFGDCGYPTAQMD